MNPKLKEQLRPYLGAFREMCQANDLPYCVAVGDGEGEVLEEMSAGSDLPPKVRLPIEAVRAEGSPDALMNTLLSEMPKGSYSRMAQVHAEKVRDQAAEMARQSGRISLARQIDQINV